MKQKTTPPLSVGDRVTLVKSPSLPDSMVGYRAIIQGVDPHTEEDYMKYHVIYRMDGKSPIRIGTDVLADEYLDRSNMRLGWGEMRDLGDGAPVLVEPCSMCGVCPSSVDDCGEFGNSLCPYFGKDSKQSGN